MQLRERKFEQQMAGTSSTWPTPFALTFSTAFLVLHLFLDQILQVNALTVRNNTPAIIIFGDSIVDPGNNNYITTIVKCDFPPYGRDFPQQKPTGRFCNGRIPSDLIASALGIKELLPAYLDSTLKPDDLLTGVSFASGGSGYDPQTSKLVSVLSLDDQINLFKEYIAKLEAFAGEEKARTIVSKSIYLVFVGTDDLVNTYFTFPFRRAHYDVPSYATFLVQCASSFYQDLYKLGARRIAVAGLPPIGCLPSQRTLAGGITRECENSRNEAAKLVNSLLSKEINRLASELQNSKVVYVDIYNILLDLIQEPSNYGFEVSNKGCCGTGLLEVTVLCNSLSPHTCSEVTDYVFWDSYHPTEKAYKVIVDKLVADYISLL